MPTGVFNPFKLTGRPVIIGSLVLLYHFTEIVVSFTQTAYTLSDIISFTICLVSMLDLHCLSNSFIQCMGARHYWAFKMTVFKSCRNVFFVCACGLLISQQSFSHIGTFHKFLG